MQHDSAINRDLCLFALVPGIHFFASWFLIDKDNKPDEGMELIDKALTLIPDSWAMLDTKGWGLYKQGKYQEALKVIQKADSIKPFYSQDVFMHLEAVKKTLASQKNN
jgi:tetratricopeptide (TPR) repeat protein